MAVTRPVFEDVHDALRATVRQWVERSVAPHHERFRQQGHIDREVWLEAGKLGLLGFGLPERHGGAGIDDFRCNAVLNEELSRQGLALASAFQVHLDVVAPYLVQLADDEQQARWLPRYATGEAVGAIGMTEPSGGSDLAALRTRAVRDGSDWIINGTKTFITNGSTADLVVLAARTDPTQRSRGISLFVVEAGTPGFTCGRKLQKVGQPEADTADLLFDDVRVPAGNLLGEEGRGWAHMMERLPQERLSTAISNVAHARAALDATLAYVKERTAFGQPVGSFQHNRFLLAELTTTLDVAQVFVDHCLAQHVAGTLDPTQAAQAKYWTAEAQNRVIDACVQLHGGYGYMDEQPVARAWADARITRIWAGTDEIMKELIGRSLGL
jgi:alkylation response protein AidB-like acyl-CoA dehydrogenase